MNRLPRFAAFDRLRQTFADGSMRSYTYDLASNLVGYTDENGSIFAYTVDAIGRRTETAITPATGVGGTTTQTFQYDPLSRLTQAGDVTIGFSSMANFYYDSLNRVLEEKQYYDGNTGYVTHDQWTSLTATDLTYPNARQIASGYDSLYRRNAINETSGGSNIASWQFFGPTRIAETTLGNGLICTQMNNARTNSSVQSTLGNPSWGDQSSDRLGYDGVGRMMTKRYLAGGINGSTYAYNTPTSLVGLTTCFDRSSNKL